MIGAHGMWNAATAVSHGMDVATANPTEFERVSGPSWRSDLRYRQGDSDRIRAPQMTSESLSRFSFEKLAPDASEYRYGDSKRVVAGFTSGIWLVLAV